MNKKIKIIFFLFTIIISISLCNIKCKAYSNETNINVKTRINNSYFSLEDFDESYLYSSNYLNNVVFIITFSTYTNITNQQEIYYVSFLGDIIDDIYYFYYNKFGIYSYTFLENDKYYVKFTFNNQSMFSGTTYYDYGCYYNINVPFLSNNVMAIETITAHELAHGFIFGLLNNSYLFNDVFEDTIINEALPMYLGLNYAFRISNNSLLNNNFCTSIDTLHSDLNNCFNLFYYNDFGSGYRGYSDFSIFLDKGIYTKCSANIDNRYSYFITMSFLNEYFDDDFYTIIKYAIQNFPNYLNGISNVNLKGDYLLDILKNLNNNTLLLNQLSYVNDFDMQNMFDEYLEYITYPNESLSYLPDIYMSLADYYLLNFSLKYANINSTSNIYSFPNFNTDPYYTYYNLDDVIILNQYSYSRCILKYDTQNSYSNNTYYLLNLNFYCNVRLLLLYENSYGKQSLSYEFIYNESSGEQQEQTYLYLPKDTTCYMYLYQDEFDSGSNTTQSPTFNVSLINNYSNLIVSVSNDKSISLIKDLKHSTGIEQMIFDSDNYQINFSSFDYFTIKIYDQNFQLINILNALIVNNRYCINYNNYLDGEYYFIYNKTNSNNQMIITEIMGDIVTSFGSYYNYSQNLNLITFNINLILINDDFYQINHITDGIINNISYCIKNNNVIIPKFNNSYLSNYAVYNSSSGLCYLQDDINYEIAGSLVTTNCGRYVFEIKKYDNLINVESGSAVLFDLTNSGLESVFHFIYDGESMYRVIGSFISQTTQNQMNVVLYTKEYGEINAIELYDNHTNDYFDEYFYTYIYGDVTDYYLYVVKNKNFTEGYIQIYAYEN